MVIIELELQGGQLYEALSQTRAPQAHGCRLEGGINRKHALHSDEIDGAAIRDFGQYRGHEGLEPWPQYRVAYRSR